MAILKELLSVGALNSHYKNYKDNKFKSGTVGLANKVFGNKYADTFDFKITAGGQTFTPKPIQASSFNADVMLRGYSVGVSYKGDKPFYREAMALNEKDRIQIINLERTNATKEEIALVAKELLDNFSNFLYSMPALQAVIAGQFLSTGQVKVDDNGVSSLIDYRVPSTHKETKVGTAVWSNETQSTPLSDLYTWKEKMEEEGRVVEFALMTSKTYSYILKSKEFKDLVAKTAKIVMPNEYQAIIEEYTGLKIIKWNETVEINGVKEQVFPHNVVTLLPRGELGKFEFGPTPDSVDKFAGLLPKDVEVEFLKDSYATLKVAPQIASNGALTTYGIILSSTVALNPTVIDDMVILKVAS